MTEGWKEIIKDIHEGLGDTSPESDGFSQRPRFNIRIKMTFFWYSIYNDVEVRKCEECQKQ